jgi:hypothetical protein
MRCFYPKESKPAQIVALRNVALDEHELQRLADAVDAVVVLMAPGENLEYVALESFEEKSWE